MPPRLTSTKLIVHDLDTMADFYMAALGYEQRGRIAATIGAEPFDEIFLGHPGEDGLGLILMRFTKRPEPPTGQVSLVFRTDDVDVLVARAEAAGGSIHVAPYDSELSGMRAAFIRDPEGTLIELIQLG